MKKTIFALSLAVMLLGLTIAFVGAGMDLDDPKLCVEGKWLLVDAADPAVIKVTVPEGTRYGNQQAGGCATAGPNVPHITVVVERGESHNMRVFMDGAKANPTVNVTYGQYDVTKKNNGKGMLNFVVPVK